MQPQIQPRDRATETRTAPVAPRLPLSPEAARALAEAEARRASARPASLPAELGGRDGPEPVRFGDWERKGLAIDF